jgi:hypothetical protein
MRWSIRPEATTTSSCRADCSDVNDVLRVTPAVAIEVDRV